MVKALGIGFGQGLYPKDLSILSSARGQPYLQWDPYLQPWLDVHTVQVHMTLTHEKDYLAGFVLLSTRQVSL